MRRAEIRFDGLHDRWNPVAPTISAQELSLPSFREGLNEDKGARVALRIAGYQGNRGNNVTVEAWDSTPGDFAVGKYAPGVRKLLQDSAHRRENTTDEGTAAGRHKFVAPGIKYDTLRRISAIPLLDSPVIGDGLDGSRARVMVFVRIRPLCGNSRRCCS